MSPPASVSGQQVAGPGVLTTFVLNRDTQRVRDTVRLGTDPNTPLSAWGTHSYRCEQRVRAMPVGPARWGTWGDQAISAPVDQPTPRVASRKRQWLSDPNSLANSGKREQSAFLVRPGHVSVRRSVRLGVRSQRARELSCSVVNRGTGIPLALPIPGPPSWPPPGARLGDSSTRQWEALGVAPSASRLSREVRRM